MTTQPAASPATKNATPVQSIAEQVERTDEATAATPEPVDQADAMIAEVEREEAAGTEPEGVPLYSIRFDLLGEVLWAKPVGDWPMSAMRYLEAAIYHRFVDDVLLPASLALFNQLNPTFTQAKAMVDDWEKATAIEVGKLRASEASSRSTRRT
jgi:hypothetical protein